jgi:hypothetical protein
MFSRTHVREIAQQRTGQGLIIFHALRSAFEVKWVHTVMQLQEFTHQQNTFSAAGAVGFVESCGELCKGD